MASANIETAAGAAPTENADLGFAILVAESEEDDYEPVDIVSTMAEARELAASDMRRRLATLEGDGDPGICPYAYVLWTRQRGGVMARTVLMEAVNAN